MRLLIVGGCNGQIGAATKIAMDRGRQGHPCGRHRAGAGHAARRRGRRPGVLRRRRSTSAPWSRPARPNASARRWWPAASAPTPAARWTRSAPAPRNICPCPPIAELIAAVLAAVADESHQLVYEDEAMGAVLALADQVAGSEASILITGESGTGKEVLARYVHRKSRAQRQALHLGQLRRDPGKPAGIRTVRPREGRLHRRRRPAHRQVRGSQWRHAAAGRNQRDGCAPAGQAAARHPGARDRPRRRHQAGQGRHPHHRHLQPRPGRGGQARHVPRRPALSPECRQSAPAAACASGPRTFAPWPHHFARKYAEANGVPYRPHRRRRPSGCCCRHPWRGNVRELENTIHRAVLLAQRRGDRAGSHPPARRHAGRARSRAAVLHEPGADRRRQRRRRRPAAWSAAPSPMSSAT